MFDASKRSHILGVIFCLLLMVFATHVVAQEESESEAKAEEQTKREVLCETISGHLEKIRTKKFKHPVAVTTQSMEEFRKFVSHELDKEFDGDKAKHAQRCQVLLGLIPKDANLKKMLEDLMVSQAGAYYDPEKKHFVLLHLDLPPIIQNPIILHELQHALQDQYFNIGKALNEAVATGNDDATSAYQALVEGEATFVMTRYSLGFRFPDIKDEKLTLMLDSMTETMASTTRKSMALQGKLASALGGKDMAFLKEAMDGLKEVPNYYYWSLHAPYLNGQRFVFEIYRARGWQGVDNMFSNPPVSTEQILHPEKYLEKGPDIPQDIVFPEWTSLGDAWTLQNSNTLGELGMRSMFLDDSKLEKKASRLAAGWDGDMYQLYTSESGELLTWMSAWDSQQDATEFATGLTTRFTSLLQGEVKKESDTLTWIHNETESAFVQRGNTTVMAMRGPKAELQALLQESIK